MIGPWLGYFTQMLFDRWTSIQQALSRYELSGTVVLAGQHELLVLNDMEDFNISTYNATTFLESFTMNVPTVIFWNPNHWELRDSAIPYFEDLMRVSIFHVTPESAARHVGSIWEDVEAWWMSPDVRAALDRFTRRYCDLPPDLLGRIERSLRDLIAHSPSHPFRRAHPGI